MAGMNEHGLEAWFREYARISLGPEPEALAERYADSFLAAAPAGSAAFQNNAEFVQWLRQVHDFNEQSGMQSMDVVAVDEMPLGVHFTMATVEWEAQFQKTGDLPIRFKISYVLTVDDGSYRIIAYISHEDQEEAMKAHGLL